ncbi:type VII secretion system-associated protein [Streptomyces sp. NPDC003691]
MSSKDHPLSHLSPENLRKFRDDKEGGVEKFIKDITTLMTAPVDPDGEGTVNAMPGMARQNGTVSYVAHPLVLGSLGAAQKGDAVTAEPLTGYYKAAAGTLADIEQQQKTLFDTIKQSLLITITTMESAQDSSLDEVDSRKFLDDWMNVGKGLVPPKSV